MGHHCAQMGALVRPSGPQTIDECWHHWLHLIDGPLRIGLVAWSRWPDRPNRYIHTFCNLPQPLWRFWFCSSARGSGLCRRTNRTRGADQGIVDACIVIWRGHRHWPGDCALFVVPALWTCRTVDHVCGIWRRCSDRFAYAVAERHATLCRAWLGCCLSQFCVHERARYRRRRWRSTGLLTRCRSSLAMAR